MWVIGVHAVIEELKLIKIPALSISSIGHVAQIPMTINGLCRFSRD